MPGRDRWDVSPIRGRAPLADAFPVARQRARSRGSGPGRAAAGPVARQRERSMSDPATGPLQPSRSASVKGPGPIRDCSAMRGAAETRRPGARTGHAPRKRRQPGPAMTDGQHRSTFRGPGGGMRRPRRNAAVPLRPVPAADPSASSGNEGWRVTPNVERSSWVDILEVGRRTAGAHPPYLPTCEEGRPRPAHRQARFGPARIQ
jgi:hypothetical protein